VKINALKKHRKVFSSLPLRAEENELCITLGFRPIGTLSHLFPLSQFFFPYSTNARAFLNYHWHQLKFLFLYLFSFEIILNFNEVFFSCVIVSFFVFDRPVPFE